MDKMNCHESAHVKIIGHLFFSSGETFGGQDNYPVDNFYYQIAAGHFLLPPRNFTLGPMLIAALGHLNPQPITFQLVRNYIHDH